MVLEIRGISKRFGPIQALDDVSLKLQAGEIHALLGENGAGKSTLIKIMTGVEQPDAGELHVDGRLVRVGSAIEAQALGIAAVYQEPMIFPDLSVAENIFISHRDRGRIVDRAKMRRDAAVVLERLGARLDVGAPARGLTVAAQQTLEIAKALSLRVRVLIMDEPTASLSAHETRRLFGIVKALRREGVAILFVSHRMEDVFQIADRITVLRDGRWISTRPVGEVTPASAIRDMVGRTMSDLFRRTPTQLGEVLVDGRAVTIRNPQDALRVGIAYTTEDRRQLGLLFPLSIAANITLPTLRRYLSRFGLVRRSAEAAAASGFKERLRIRTRSVDTPAGQLSGGNQQKVVLSKWLNTKPRVFILDEPTRGLDVGAKAEVHQIIDELAHDGIAIILISSEL